MKQSRRRFLSKMALTVAGASAVTFVDRVRAAGDAQKAVTEIPSNKSLLGALKYTKKSEKKGQDCANCQFYQGKASDSLAKCQIIPNGLVHKEGWCASWRQKA